jgi:hypothetical protein
VSLTNDVILVLELKILADNDESSDFLPGQARSLCEIHAHYTLYEPSVIEALENADASLSMHLAHRRPGDAVVGTPVAVVHERRTFPGQMMTTGEGHLAVVGCPVCRTEAQMCGGGVGVGNATVVAAFAVGLDCLAGFHSVCVWGKGDIYVLGSHESILKTKMDRLYISPRSHRASIQAVRSSADTPSSSKTAQA